MNTTQTTTPGSEATTQNSPEQGDAPRRWAQVHYMSIGGNRVDFEDLSDGLAELALSLEDLRQMAEAAGQEAMAEEITDLAGSLAAVTPDPEALEPEPEELGPVLTAQFFLAAERRRAQEILREEAQRIRKETLIRESFCMLDSTLTALVEAIAPDAGPGDLRDIYRRAEEVLDSLGWTVGLVSNPLHARTREPLRQLADILDNHSGYHFARQVMEIIGHARDWCANSSYDTTRNGAAFPLLSMRLVPVEGGRKAAAQKFGERESCIEFARQEEGECEGGQS